MRQTWQHAAKLILNRMPHASSRSRCAKLDVRRAGLCWAMQPVTPLGRTWRMNRLGVSPECFEFGKKTSANPSARKETT
jgi:hypothetical protein